MKIPKRDGVLMLYSVPRSAMLKKDELEPIIQKYNLDASLMPKESSGPDKFRKAFKSVLARGEWRSITDSQGRKVQLTATVVQNNKSRLQMDLMQQVIQGGMDKAGFLESPVEHSVFKMFYHKDIGNGGANSITFQMPRLDDGSVDTSSWVDGVDYATMIQQVIDQQQKYVNEIDGLIAAEMMKSYIKRLNARQFRRFRGAHYIPEENVPHAERFRDAMREWSDGQIDIALVPMFDNMMGEVREFFENGMLEDVTAIFKEIDVSGQMQDRKIARLERELADMENLARVYDGKIDRSKIETAIIACQGQLGLAKEANLRWKEGKEAERIRAKEEKKRMMKANKETTMEDEDRMSVL